MTASDPTTGQTQPRSRRALLAGALGGVGVWVANAVTRQPARAANGNPVILGQTNTATLPTIGNTDLSGGLFWTTGGGNAAAIVGNHIGSAAGSGVRGASSSDTGRGILGEASGPSAFGVMGNSSEGHAIHGHTFSGWAGYFEGRVFMTKYLELREIPNPSAPPVNHAKLFLRDNGSGRTQLCVRFHSGAVKVLAIEP